MKCKHCDRFIVIVALNSARWWTMTTQAEVASPRCYDAAGDLTDHEPDLSKTPELEEWLTP